MISRQVKILRFPDSRKPREPFYKSMRFKIAIKLVLLWFVVAMIVMLLTNCGTIHAQPTLPMRFKVDVNFPEDRILYVTEAFEIWNRSLDVLVFTYEGRSSDEYNSYDNHNVIFWWAGTLNSDIAVADATWDLSSEYLPEHPKCDVRVRRTLFEPVVIGPSGGVIRPELSNKVLLETLLHELGHCLNIGHTDNSLDLMYKSLTGTMAPSPWDIERAKDELMLPGGVHGD